MTIAQDLVNASLRKLGNHSPQLVDQNNALQALNGLIASLSARRLFIPSLTRENFPLTINVGSYTIGPSGTFNTVRPSKIENAYLRDGTLDYSLNVVTNLSDYDRITLKNTKSIPTGFVYLQEFPLGAILFNYAPDKAYILFIDSWKALTGFASLPTPFSMPPEYERALIFNLAVEIASEYDQNLAQEVMAIANESMAIIEAVNHQPPAELGFDCRIVGAGSRQGDRLQNEVGFGTGRFGMGTFGGF